MAETLFAPFTVDDLLTLLPGVNERALKEKLRKHGCYIKGSRPMMITLAHIKALMEATKLKPAAKYDQEEPVGRPGFIYFVTCDLPDDTALVKIGYARELGPRISALQTSCPLPLRVLHSMPGSRTMERAIHHRFSHLRRSGEWFVLTADLEQEIMWLRDA
jgi:hypothetical protein